MKTKLTKAELKVFKSKTDDVINLICDARDAAFTNPYFNDQHYVEGLLLHAAAYCLELAVKLKGRRMRK